ncbi:hypothetical protein [Aeropyrum pernix]|uniref:hypothetical protein n=1 Tax=Aeropyrum pernix TaxID=56636 RepID=UPI001037718F|nr:hypothetical protein [Aeropyrum pernix]
MLAKKYPFLLGLDRVLELVTGFRGEAARRVLAGDEDLVGLGFRRAVAAVEGWLDYPFADTVEGEVASFYLGLAIAYRAGPAAVSRVVAGEYLRASRLLAGEPGEVASGILGGLGFPVERGGLSVPWVVDRRGVVMLPLGWRMGVDVFLRLSAADESSPELRLANQMLLSGSVYLSDARLRALASAASRLAIESRVSEAASLESEAVERYARHLAALAEGGLPFIPEALPQCLKNVFAKAVGGERLGWLELYLALVFLARIRAGPDVVEELLTPSLGERVARLLARVYSQAPPADHQLPPCEVLAASGVCRCRGSLLSEYRRSVRSLLGLPDRGAGRR